MVSSLVGGLWSSVVWILGISPTENAPNSEESTTSAGYLAVAPEKSALISVCSYWIIGWCSICWATWVSTSSASSEKSSEAEESL